MRRKLLFVSLLALLIILAACADKGSPTQAVEAYLQAQVAGDEDKLVSLACASWEDQAIGAAASFRSVDARIENLACKETGTDGDDTLVRCSGTIVIQYRGEDPREQPLPDLTYRARQEDGQWKMCGTQ